MTTRATGSGVSGFAATLLDMLDRVTYRPVRLSDLDDPVYKLRYEAYRREDFIPMNSQGVAGDKYDESPNAYCYGVYIDEQLVSSIRFHHVTPDERSSPSRSIYPEILGPLLDEGKTYVDPSRFTADHDATLAFPALPFLTTRIIVMASDYFKVDFCLSSVRPEHGAFYRRVFHSTKIADERYYEGLQFPVCMYSADVPKVLSGIYARYPTYRSTPEERESLFGNLTSDEKFKIRVPASARFAQSEEINLPPTA